MGVSPVNRMKLVSGVSATAAIAAAALAGCSSGGSGTTSASGSSAPASSPSGSGAPASAASTPAGTPASTTATGSGGTTTTSSRCATKDLSLRVLQGPQEEGSTTGSFYVELTNVSARTCTLYGFPGVELIGGVGGTPKPLGMKDVWTAKLSTAGQKVQTLAPHTASAAFVNFSTRDPGASADVPRAEQVQVIPPNQTTALTARIYNVDAGYVTPLVTTTTLTVGPMDVDAVPHK
jgi:hypothetical protein